jgi:hypothetical protein
MNKQELELALVNAQREISRRDHLLKRCYWKVLQIRDNGHDKLLQEMAEWRPETPVHIHPRTYIEGATS